MIRNLLLVAALAAGSSSAQSYVVDAAGGPGHDFTSLPAAIAAVPDGATLHVRAGYYDDGLEIPGKGLRVLGEPGVVIRWPTGVPTTAFVYDLAPHQTVVLRDLEFGASFQPFPSLQMIDCDGLVHVEGVAGGFFTLSGTNCARISIRGGGWRASTFFGCNVTAEGAQFLAGQGAGIRAEDSAIELVDCVVRGGPVFVWYAEALLLTNTVVKASGGTRLEGAALPVSGYAPAIQGTGLLRFDPSTTVVGSQPPASQLPMLSDALPHLERSDAALGGAVVTTLRGPVGALGAIVAGYTGPVVQLPGLLDRVWLDLAALDFQAVGVLDDAAPLASSTNVPDDPALAGAVVVWQGVTIDAVGCRLTSPTHFVIRD